MRAHTPGPWTEQEDIRFLETDPPKILSIYSEHKHIADVSWISNTEQVANARLIAASPDLLAVCDEMCIILQSELGENMSTRIKEALNKMYKAIAKSE